VKEVQERAGVRHKCILRGQNWVPMVVVQDAPDRPVYQSTGMTLVGQVRDT